MGKRVFSRIGLVSMVLVLSAAASAREDEAALSETPLEALSSPDVPSEEIPLPGPEPGPLTASPTANGSLDVRWNQHRETGIPENEKERFATGQFDLIHRSADGRWVFESGALYQEYAESPWVRDQTRISYLNPERNWVATAGDFATSFRGFQNSFLVAGLSLKKGRSVENDRIVFRRSTYELVFSDPATFEIFVGNQLFIQGRREAGVLDLRSYALLRNRKDVRVRITDDFGRQDVFRFDLYAEMRLLERTEQDYFYQIGYLSKDVPGERAYHGRSVMTSFSHRYGLNERLTLGLNYQNFEYRHLGGMELSTLQDAGFFALDWAGTDVSGSQGFAVRLRWKDQFDGGRLGADAMFEERTEFFLPFRQEGIVMEEYRRRLDAGLMRGQGDWNLFGVGASYEEGFLSVPARRVLRGDWTHFLRTNLTLEGTVYQQQGLRPEHGGRLSLTWFESPTATSVSAFHDSLDHTTNFHGERPLRGDEKDGMIRVNARRTPAQGDEIDARASVQNSKARLRVHSFEDRALASRSSEGILGVDSSLRWGSEGWGVEPPAP